MKADAGGRNYSPALGRTLKLLVAENAIGERLSASMLAWRHSGFSVHNGVRARKAVPAAAVQAPEDAPVVAGRARSAWARLIHKVHEVDPLVCAKCGAPMHVIALIDDATVIRRILEHLGLWAPRQPRQNQRAPPAAGKGIDGLQPPVQEWSYHPVPDIA